MTQQIRFPNKIIQSKIGAEWNDLENIKIDNWESLASVELSSKKRPASLYLKNFNFKVPEDSRINSIEIFHDFHRSSSQTPIEVEPPKFKVHIGNRVLENTSHINAAIRPVERNVMFFEEDIYSNDLNDKYFYLEVIFPRNTSKNTGKLFLDYVNIRITYETQIYSLTSGESSSYFPDKDNPLEKAVGDEVIYTLSFRNFNGILEDKQKVQLYLPEGIEIKKYYYKASKTNKLDEKYIKNREEDTFDEENNIWYPSVRGKGVSRIRFILNCTSEGLKKIYAFNNYTDNTPNFYVNVHPESYESKSNKFEETLNKWVTELKDNEEYNLLNKELAINVEDVSMEFEMPQEKIDNLKEYIIKFLKRELKPKIYFKALEDVSFKVFKGERVGIIGFNGAGKSTLLKILSGVLKPTKGSIFTNGKVAPLLELGAGFDHNYSGSENIFLNGAILGYSKEFLKSKYDEIVEFSELGDFIDIPIKNYSSGMNAKLGFSVATIVEPDVLILDEILSVGDVKFQKKSGDKLKSMMGSGTTVLIVSHSVAKIRELCNRAIWLDKGKVVMDGDVDFVCDAYIESAKKASEEELQNLELE